MTDVDEELEFLIPAYTPETMPLDRLLEYLEQIVAVVGNPSDMHLVRIEASSTKPILKMPRPIAVRARESGTAIQNGNGTIKQRGAYNKIRDMIRKDGGERASLNDRMGVVLAFPAASEDSGAMSGIRQMGHFDGELIKVGGPGEQSAIQMQSLSGEVLSGFSAPRYLAKEMGSLLFEPLRLYGIGWWDRNSNGHWKLGKMAVQSYERISNEPLVSVFEKLRNTAVDWPEDADELLAAERASHP